MTKIKLCNLRERERERENFARDPTPIDYFLLKANPVANF